MIIGTLILIVTTSWLYMLILAMDANFRLQSKLRGISKSDTTLNAGMAYFVDNEPYKNFIKDYVDVEEVCFHYASKPCASAYLLLGTDIQCLQ